MASPTPNTSSSVSYFTVDNNTSNNIKALIQDVKWGASGLGTGASIYYSFPTTNANAFWSNTYTAKTNSELTEGFSAATTVQQNAVTSGLQKWANVANITFTAVAETTNNVGDIRVANTLHDMQGGSTYAYAYLPALNNAIGGDVWINANQPVATGNNYNVGQNGYHTLIHELGHALGLDHPFEGDNKLSVADDNLKFTVMSYSDAPSHDDSGFSSYYPTTPMLLDIQAIQFLYGANTNYNTGNNTYAFNDSTTYYETIWDAGGTDTIQYTGTAGATINLNAGTYSSMGQAITLDSGATQNDNIAIAYNVTIENAIGGSGNDVIAENSASNIINGGAGADTVIYNINQSQVTYIRPAKIGGAVIVSSQGTDTLQNIESVKFLDTTTTTDALIAAKNTPTFLVQASGSVTPDIYTSNAVNYIEYQFYGDNSTGDIVIGSSGNDFINVLGGDDAVTGGLGDDIIDGGIGSNFLTGGGDNDTFFLDGRNTLQNNTWSTITDFSADEINIWGWVAGTSKLLFKQENAGADNYKGATYHYDLNNDGAINTSLTFTGMSIAEVDSSVVFLEGNVGGLGYLFIG